MKTEKTCEITSPFIYAKIYNLVSYTPKIHPLQKIGLNQERTCSIDVKQNGKILLGKQKSVVKIKDGSTVRYASIFARKYGTLVQFAFFCNGTGTVRLFRKGTGTVRWYAL